MRTAGQHPATARGATHPPREFVLVLEIVFCFQSDLCFSIHEVSEHPVVQHRVSLQLREHQEASEHREKAKHSLGESGYGFCLRYSTWLAFSGSWSYF